jgi:hypothetical protein
MSYKGFFKPKNPAKYKGDPTKIIYRSSWECRLMAYLDDHPNVVQWCSEEFSIPYRSPIDNKVHRYFPDFWVKQTVNGKTEILVLEVKPRAQTIAPKPQKKVTRQYVTEVKTWGINSAKWKAAEEYCMDRKWKFMIMDEYSLGIQR